MAESPQTAALRRVVEFNQPGSDIYNLKDPTKQQEAMIKLRAAMAAAELPEEKAARAMATPLERRSQYGVTEPPLHKHEIAQYNEDYAGWESHLYDVADENGMAAPQVRAIRDLAGC